MHVTYENPVSARTITPNPVPSYTSPYAPPPGPVGQGLGVASLVCGIVGLAGLGSLLAVVFGHVSRHQARRAGAVPSGLALAGLVIGYIGLAVLPLLAAIAIPTFLSQREKGYESTMSSELHSAAIAQESFAVDNNGNHYTRNQSDMEANGYVATPVTPVFILRADETTFCLAAETQGTDRVMYYDSVTGDVSTTPCG